MFKIKTFSRGKVRECDTADELMLALNDYAGDSVAVHQVLQSGIVRARFVDVMADGRICESFGDNSDITAIYFS
jgi:hypothetical protein